MRSCPRCTFPLTPYTHEGDEIDHCQRCDGTFIDHGATAAKHGPLTNPEFWKQSYVTKLPTKSDLACPRCSLSLDAYILKHEEQELEIDECERCHSLWFDRDEGPHLASMMENAQLHEETMNARRGSIKSYLFQLLTQFPLEVWNPVRHRPWVVYSLLSLLTLAFLWQLQNLAFIGEHYSELLMVPSDISEGEHLWTLMSAGFFHADWMHLLGNMWMLWIFGDNVEDRLRKKNFALLYGGALLAASVAEWLFDTGSHSPVLGASGAVAGLMGAYLVLFPKVKVWTMLVIFRVKLKMYWYLGFWVGLQVVMAALKSEGVAWFAHLGGFVFGVAFALLLKPSVSKRITGTRAV